MSRSVLPDHSSVTPMLDEQRQVHAVVPLNLKDIRLNLSLVRPVARLEGGACRGPRWMGRVVTRSYRMAASRCSSRRARVSGVGTPAGSSSERVAEPRSAGMPRGMYLRSSMSARGGNRFGRCRGRRTRVTILVASSTVASVPGLPARRSLTQRTAQFKSGLGPISDPVLQSGFVICRVRAGYSHRKVRTAR